MNKKFLSLVLALVMVLGTLTPVFAEEAAPKDKIEKAAKTAPSAKVQWLVDEKIVSGSKIHEDGEEKISLSLDKNLQRDQITRLLVLGKGLENLANLVQGTMRPYVDVDNANWANGVITVGSYHLKNAQGVPMLAGYPGNKFLPLRNVTYAELAKMLVCLVDNSITPKMVENFQWPSDWMVRAARLGIFAGIEVKDSNAFVTRQVAFEMLYNALYLYDTAHHVDYGTKYGVVSGYANGELRLNQGDKAFSVKYSGETVYVNNSGYATHMPLGGEYKGLVLGSLVRVIADKDGNATYIVEIGNPVNGPIAGRWNGVADKTVRGLADFNWKGSKDMGSITVKHDTWLTAAQVKAYEDSGILPVFPAKQISNVQIDLTSNTKYFVADANRNYLTEVDRFTAQDLVRKAYYDDETQDIPNVYVGYDVLAKGMAGRQGTEARVVVFNVVRESNQDWATVRVTQPSNGVYNFYAENTKGEVTEYSLRKYAGAMPGFERPNGINDTNTAGYNGHFEKLNVLALDLNKDTKEVFGTGLLIRYITDPSFKVVKAEYDHGKLSLLTLEGQNGVRIPRVRVDLERTKLFLEGQWTQAELEGKYIQLSRNNIKGNSTTGFYIDNGKAKEGVRVISGAISILDHPQNLAKINKEYGQDKNFRIVRISELEQVTENGPWRVKVEEVRYNTAKDSYAAQEFEAGKYYTLSSNDAAFVYSKLYENTDPKYTHITKKDAAGNEYKVISVDFEATVVLDAAGKLVEIDVDQHGTTKDITELKTLIAPTKNFTVKFDLNIPANKTLDVTKVDEQKVKSGEKANKPADPKVLDGSYKFTKWQLDGKDFDFSKETITKDITLKAVWEKVATPAAPAENNQH